MSIKINGIDRVNRIVAKLGKNLDDEVLSKSKEFMRFVLKYAKMKAPKFTGNLANSLMIYQRGKSIILSTDAYYAKFKEFGFQPHVIPMEYIQQHSSAPGFPGKSVGKVSGFVYLSGVAKPFLYPALEDGLSQLPNMLRNAVLTAVRRSR